MSRKKDPPAVAFVVGKSADNFPLKYTSKKAPKWLKIGIKDYLAFTNEDHSVPSDVAMAVYMHYHHPTATVALIDGEQIEKYTVTDFNQFDVIFVIYDAIEIFHCKFRNTCPKLKNKFERMVKHTTAHVYPPPDFHKYIINKCLYYRDLRKAKLPVANFICTTPTWAIHNTKKLKNRILKKGWKGVIIKPTYAGYSLGIRVFKNISRTKVSTLKKHFEKLQKLNFPSVVIQEFVQSFGQNYEFRMYFIGGKYAYSVGTLTAAVGHGDGLPIHGFATFQSEGGKVPNSVLRKIKPIGYAAIKAVLRYSIPHPLIRVDIGCCIGVGGCVNSYFINEVETYAANMLADHTKYPAVQKTAEASWKYVLRIRNRKKVKGRKMKKPLKPPRIPCKN